MNKRHVATKASWKILITMVLAVLASACGGVDAVDSHTSALTIDDLAMAPPSLISGDIPGCDHTHVAGAVTLLRHPFATDLLVVVVDGRAQCIDTPKGVEQYVGVPPLGHTEVRTHAAQNSTQGQTEDQSESGGNEPPSDDPIPIHSQSAHNGGQNKTAATNDVNDDPLPILSQQAATSQVH